MFSCEKCSKCFTNKGSIYLHRKSITACDNYIKKINKQSMLPSLSTKKILSSQSMSMSIEELLSYHHIWNWKMNMVLDQFIECYNNMIEHKKSIIHINPKPESEPESEPEIIIDIPSSKKSIKDILMEDEKLAQDVLSMINSKREALNQIKFESTSEEDDSDNEDEDEEIIWCDFCSKRESDISYIFSSQRNVCDNCKSEYEEEDEPIIQSSLYEKNNDKSIDDNDVNDDNEEEELFNINMMCKEYQQILKIKDDYSIIDLIKYRDELQSILSPLQKIYNYEKVDIDTTRFPSDYLTEFHKLFHYILHSYNIRIKEAKKIVSRSLQECTLDKAAYKRDEYIDVVRKQLMPLFQELSEYIYNKQYNNNKKKSRRKNDDSDSDDD